MGARRNTTLLGLMAAAAFLLAGMAAADSPDTEPRIDADGFLELSREVMDVRAGRLVSLARFNEMAAEPNTLILDTRSPEAFAAGHISGSVNLTFADFTDEKLAERIPSKDTRILIYCNNNFADNAPPVVLKRAPLALNVPTFINLVGYGYENVWELADLVETGDPAVNWVVPALH